MPRLDPNDRARLPDSAFAYIDSRGQRRLPIHDAAHVRNALARFSRVRFESDAARERARERILKAAAKFGIVPIGFITAQLRAERKAAEERAAATPSPASASTKLPAGFVTFLMCDIEGSTALLEQLGDPYRDLLSEIRAVLRAAVTEAGGQEIDARGDELFAVFVQAPAAIRAATEAQRTLSRQPWTAQVNVRVRMGIHSGRTTLTDVGYIGLSVHTVARVCSAAHGGQILISGETRTAAGDMAAQGITFRELGAYRLAGLRQPHVLCQVEAEGLATTFPELRAGRPV